jgi:excinuclease ABC subunit C
MVQINEKITQKIKLLPNQSGIYIWKNKDEEIIYVGKAKNLEKRIKSYLSDTDKDIKTLQLLKHIDDLEYIITNSETEAFILEANLIKKHKPKYNILLKDDKRYPFIKITLNEPFPRVLVTRELLRDGSKYYGPYTDSRLMRKTIRTLEWIFPIRTCKRIIPKNKIVFKNACINYQLKKCPAPCVGYINNEDYNTIVQGVIKLFSGRLQELIDGFRTEMVKASDQERFEEAALYRDRIKELEKINSTQSVYSMNNQNSDIIGCYSELQTASIVVLKVVNGKLIHQENYPMSNIEGHSDPDIISAFVKLYYSDKLEIPDEIILPLVPSELDQLNNWLGNRIVIPQRGDKTKLLVMAKKNAFHFLEHQKLAHLKRAHQTIKPVQELKERLDLPVLPRKIVCIDISNIQGTDTVSSAVYFVNGKPYKKYYRHYIIKSVDNQNDFAAVAETIQRFLDESEKSSDLKPDLFIIDGGKGQLHSAMEVMSKRGSRIPVISLAKRLEEVFVPPSSTSILLPKSLSALRLIINIRDEAHRFAVNFHRSRRSKRTLISELEEIKSIGEKTKFILLKEFGSISAIREASYEQLTSVKGIGHKTAEKVIKYFQNHSD